MARFLVAFQKSEQRRNADGLPVCYEKSTSAEYWNALKLSGSFDRVELKRPRCMVCRRRLQAFVVHPESQLARAWHVVTGLLLAYVATVFPYRLCFLEFRVDIQDDYEAPLGWKVFEVVVDIVFWTDLVFNFFLAIRDECGNLITDNWKIAKAYLARWFWIDLLACLDPKLIMLLLGGSGPTNTNKAVRFLRMYRLGRLSRLFKLMRLWRLLRLMTVVQSALKFPVFHALERVLSYRHTISMIKLVIGILWLAHILGCGLYLVVSACVNSKSDTWLHRRGLLDATPFEQWVSSFYFVLTALLTVGFGDIYPLHSAEMLCFLVLELIGIIVQCVVLSEISKALSGWREEAKAREALQFNLRRYITQAKLGDKEAVALTHALLRRSQHESQLGKGAGYDRSKVLQLLKSTLPRNLQRSVARRVFHGVCGRNAFFDHNTSVVDTFSLSVAAYLTSHRVQANAYLYHFGDTATNIFLVLEGIAAHVAQPSASGGHFKGAEMDRYGIAFSRLDSPFWLLPSDTYFGDLEIVLNHGPRISSVRAETDMELLCLPKPVLVLLSKDFPEFVSNLRYAALDRRRRFGCLLKRLVSPREFRHWAACIIQHAFRAARSKLMHTKDHKRLNQEISSFPRKSMAKPQRRPKQPSQRGGRLRRRAQSNCKTTGDSNRPSRPHSNTSKVNTTPCDDDAFPMAPMTKEEAASFLVELQDLRNQQELLERKRIEILQNQKTMLNILSQLHFRLVHDD